MAVPTSDSANQVVFSYVRWKALLLGGMISALGLLTIWVGVDALSPAWSAEISDGALLVAAPWWVRGPFMIAAGFAMLAPGLWQLWAALTKAPVVSAGDQGITARTSFGRMRRLAWRDIAEIKEKQNQIVLSPVGIDTLGQEIWDRKSVLLDTGMLDAAPGGIKAIIARHRPDLKPPPVS